MKFSIGWHVLYVKSRCERKVDQYLKELSLESFLPQIKTVRQWSDRKKTILKPLFPSYVFVNLKTSLEFHQALSVNGACAYVSFGQMYARVSEKEIDQIKLLTGDSDIVDFEVSSAPLKVGDMKKITYGSLKGLKCKIIRADNMNKIMVRVASLRQNVTITTPAYYLEEV